MKYLIGTLALSFFILVSTQFGCAPSTAEHAPSTDKYFNVDGTDTIRLTKVQEYKPEPNIVRFNFITAPEITSWKGIKVFDKNEKEILFLETEKGNHGLGFLNRFDISQFGDKIKIEFWKAKEADTRVKVETMYFKSEELKGVINVFYWMND